LCGSRGLSGKAQNCPVSFKLRLAMEEDWDYINTAVHGRPMNPAELSRHILLLSSGRPQVLAQGLSPQ